MDSATTSSFAFLAPYGPLYLRLATGAERALAVDPSLTLVSLRQLSEAFARHAAARAGLLADNRDGSGSQLDLLRSLEQRGIVRDQIAEIFHMLRRVGNRAAHDFVGTHQDAVNGLQLGFKLACWFHRTFGDAHARGPWKPPAYSLPADPTATLRALQEEANRARAEADAHKADAAKAKLLLEAEAARRAEEASLRKTAEAERHEWEALAHAFEQDLNQATTEQAKLVEAAAVEAAKAPATQETIVVQAAAATVATVLDERETRVLIDAQLRDAGWEVSSRTLTWASGARPEKGKNRAIAEVPTWTKEDGPGIADYVLFVGVTPYAVVEAKKKAKRIPSSLEQSKRYARGLGHSSPPSQASEGPAPGWATTLATARGPRYLVPFLYATNGRPYLRQLESESGVWFLDVRHPTNHPRNRAVITDGFNRAVAGELANHLDPFDGAKTIIFCVDDDHAERLVPILKEALEVVNGPLDTAWSRRSLAPRIDRSTRSAGSRTRRCPRSRSPSICCRPASTSRRCRTSCSCGVSAAAPCTSRCSAARPGCARTSARRCSTSSTRSASMTCCPRSRT